MSKAINVECKASSLSIEALNWLENYTQDLAWTQHNWRVWQSPAEYDELCEIGKVTWRFNERHGIPIERKMIRRSVDVVRFASKRDAMYFKLIFL